MYGNGVTIGMRIILIGNLETRRVLPAALLVYIVEAVGATMRSPAACRIGVTLARPLSGAIWWASELSANLRLMNLP